MILCKIPLIFGLCASLGGALLLEPQRQIPADKILVVNEADSNLVFYLSNDRINWSRCEIEANGDETYDFRRFFRIGTEGEEVRRSLERGRRYKIKWDKADKRWTLVELVPRTG